MNRREFLKVSSISIAGLLIPILTHSKENNKNLILTFDDVPYELERTKKLTNLLHQYSYSNSQFYLTGKGMKKHPKSVEYLISNGFSVGWHSMNHENMRAKNDSDLLKDILDWKKQLKEIIPNYNSKLARFPYGMGLDKQISLLNSQGLSIYPCSSKGIHPSNWDIDTMDWNPEKSYTSNQILAHANKYTKRDIIVLFHQQLAKPYKMPNNNVIYESLLTSDLKIFEEILKEMSK